MVGGVPGNPNCGCPLVVGGVPGNPNCGCPKLPGNCGWIEGLTVPGLSELGSGEGVKPGTPVAGRGSALTSGFSGDFPGVIANATRSPPTSLNKSNTCTTSL